jgi:hypothetical protein
LSLPPQLYVCVTISTTGHIPLPVMFTVAAIVPTEKAAQAWKARTEEVGKLCFYTPTPYFDETWSIHECTK